MRSLVSSASFPHCGWPVVLFLVVGVGGCTAGGQSGAAQEGSSARSDTTARRSVTDEAPIQDTGTIRYVDLEGGFYGLIGEEGTKYAPTPFPDSLRVDGLRVRFEARKKNVMTTRMWGTPIELLDVRRIEDENG